MGGSEKYFPHHKRHTVYVGQLVTVKFCHNKGFAENFGRHVAICADFFDRRVFESRSPSAKFVHLDGETQIGDDGSAIVGDKNVTRFDVAMGDRLLERLVRTAISRVQMLQAGRA